MVVALSARAVMPLVKTVGPGGRYLLLLLVVGGAPVAMGVQLWSRKKERERAAISAERARARARHPK